MRRYYSVVRWQPIDIHRLRPSWTKEQCAQALAEWEERLEEATIRAGWECLEFAIGIENRDFYWDYTCFLDWDDMPEEPEDPNQQELKEEVQQPRIATPFTGRREMNKARRKLQHGLEALGSTCLEPGFSVYSVAEYDEKEQEQNWLQETEGYVVEAIDGTVTWRATEHGAILAGKEYVATMREKQMYKVAENLRTVALSCFTVAQGLRQPHDSSGAFTAMQELCEEALLLLNCPPPDYATRDAEETDRAQQAGSTLTTPNE